MPTLEKQLAMRAPPAKIYAVLSNFDDALWVPGMKECKQVTPGAFGVGTKAHQVKMQMGRPTEVEVTVAEAVPDQRTKLVAVPKGRPPATVTWEMAPQGEGATLVKETISFELPGLMKLMTPMVKGALSKEMDETIATLKKKVEA
jgi:carbon monoxide dehydrogenase subunit G